MAAIPPPASLLGDSDVPPPPSEIQEPSSDEWSKMSAREKKLFQLRLKAVSVIHLSFLMKQNSARKINHKQVVEEDRRAQEGPNFEKMRLKQQREEEKEKKRKELEEAGLDPEKEEILTATATDAEWLDKKRKNGQKDKGSFGWDQFNVEAQFNAHKKRMKMAEKKFSKEEYEKQKALQGEDFFRGAHFIGYGSSSNVSEEGVERMVKELDES